MSENDTKAWEISISKGAMQIDLPDMTTLDAITRQLPQGYYSTFRTFDHGKRALGISAHLRRLYKPADMQAVKVDVDAGALRGYLREVLHAYGHEARVRVILTREGKLYIVTEALKKVSPKIYSKGVKVVTTQVQRVNPRLKSTAFISASKNTRAEISRMNVFEALLVRNGAILEGMTSNFFYLFNGELGTARQNILLGVTRRIVLRIARRIGLEILYHPLKREQIPALSEAFITSSSRGIVPVVGIDDIPVGKGAPGPTTKILMNGYANYVKQHAEKI